MSKIFFEAIKQYDPSAIFAMFSGGDDSLALTHYISQIAPEDRPFYVVHINTGIGVEATRAFVRRTCQDYGWDLLEYQTPESYAELVAEHGFPGSTRTGHRWMYRRLKDRCIEALVRDHKRAWNGRSRRFDRLLLVTGIRQSESRVRMAYDKPVSRRYCQVWCNALFDWSDQDVNAYKQEHNLPQNEVSKILGYSGECLCGAFATPDERMLIETFFPEEAAHIRELERQARANGHDWAWHESPPSAHIRKPWVKELEQGQQPLFDFMPLCVGCEAKAGPR